MADSGLGKGSLIQWLSDAAATLEAARFRVNRRPRAVMGWKSADEQHRRMKKEYSAAERKAIYEDGCRAMEHAMQGMETVRARHLAARLVVLTALEQYGITKQTPGSEARQTGKNNLITTRSPESIAFIKCSELPSHSCWHLCIIRG